MKGFPLVLDNELKTYSSTFFYIRCTTQIGPYFPRFDAVSTVFAEITNLLCVYKN